MFGVVRGSPQPKPGLPSHSQQFVQFVSKLPDCLFLCTGSGLERLKPGFCVFFRVYWPSDAVPGQLTAFPHRPTRFPPCPTPFPVNFTGISGRPSRFPPRPSRLPVGRHVCRVVRRHSRMLRRRYRPFRRVSRPDLQAFPFRRRGSRRLRRFSRAE